MSIEGQSRYKILIDLLLHKVEKVLHYKELALVVFFDIVVVFDKF